MSIPIHVLPINDIEEHQESTTCHCHPAIQEESGTMIIVHNSFDGRELVEDANNIIEKQNKTKV